MKDKSMFYKWLFCWMLTLLGCNSKTENSPSSSATTAGSNSSSSTTGAAGSGSTVNSNAVNQALGGMLGPQIRYIGRSDSTTNGGIAFAWPLSGFEIQVNGGSQVTFTLLNQQHAQYNIMDAYIDGVFSQAFAINDGQLTYMLPLPNGNHAVRLLKRNEAGNGTALLARIDSDGVLANAPSGPNKLIEFIGDTLMTGYAALGNPGQTSCTLPPDCVADPNLENSELAYPYLTASSLNADFSLIAYSSRGLMHNLSGATLDTLPSIYNRLDPWHVAPTWNFAVKPQAIVVNVGSYDVVYWLNNPNITADMNGFTNTYINFVQKQLRPNNPSAFILLTLGPQLNNYQCFNSTLNSNNQCIDNQGNVQPGILTLMETATNNVVNTLKQAGDQRVSYLEFPGNSTDVTCDYVPDQAGHKKISAQLAPAIARLVGW